MTLEQARQYFATAPGEPSRTRLLVVDDHADSANSLGRLLRRQGFQTEIAYDGPSALAAARAFQPEIVLLDIDLPKMDGCEVAVRLRQITALRNCFLIAVTGYDQDEVRKRCREAGFDHHILKPTDWESLHSFISDCLAKRQATSTAQNTRSEESSSETAPVGDGRASLLPL